MLCLEILGMELTKLYMLCEEIILVKRITCMHIIKSVVTCKTRMLRF